MKIVSCNIANVNEIKHKQSVSFGNKGRELANAFSIKDLSSEMDKFVPEYPPQINCYVAKITNSYWDKIKPLAEQLHDIDSQDFTSAYLMQKEGEFKKLFSLLEIIKDSSKRETFFGKDPGEFKLLEALDRLDDKTQFGMYIKSDADNCIMVVHEDPQVSEKFIDSVNFYIKSRQKYLETFRGYNFDYVKLPGNPDNSALQESIGEALDKAEEYYKKSGRETLLYVPDMERLCDPNRNTAANIACMKEMMNTCGKENHTTIIFAAKNPSILDPGTMVPHRVGYRAMLDSSTTTADFKFIDRISAKYTPYMEKRYKMLDEYYEKTVPLAEEIRKLQEECKAKIEEVIQKFKNGDLKIPETTNSKNKFDISSQLKKLLKSKAFILGNAVVFAGLGIFLYKNSQKKQKGQSDKPIEAKQNIIKPQYLPPPVHNNDVFKKIIK